MDWNYITTRLATGAAIKNDSDVQTLAAGGIRAVVSVCEDNAELLVRRAGLDYLWNPTADDGTPKSAEWFDVIIQFVLKQLLKPKISVYIHCHMGHQRGPSATYAVMRAQGWHADTALAEIRLRRPVLNGSGIGYAKDADAAIRKLGYSYVL